MTEQGRPSLRALADRVGIASAYVDITGAERRTPDAVRETLLAAMGIDASTEAAAEQALAGLERSRRSRPLDAAYVIPWTGTAPPRLRVHLPMDALGRLRWELELTREDGRRVRGGGSATTVKGRTAFSVRLPENPGFGYHRVALRLDLGGRVCDETAAVIVTPDRCFTAAEALRDRRSFGLWANLYSIRGGGSWGVGDLGDLNELVRWSGREGAAFVGLNPLHALRNHDGDISPYSPVSRLYRNPIYLDVQAVPEFAQSERARALVESPDFRAALATCRAGDRVDYERVMALKRSVLEVLHREFVQRHRGSDTERGRAYAAYRERQGDPLTQFATFMALEDQRRRDELPAYWREWPEELRQPGTRAVTEFRAAHENEVDFHRYLQFETDRQLGRAAAVARDAGMPIGLYQDLAIGTSDGGSDVWAFGHLFNRGVRVGAPPDQYAAAGQDWGLPPIDPNRLAADGYRYWIRLVRSAFDHAGALRIDHAMGMRRLYWIPPGLSPREGAYVRYPERELLGILALESQRHRAVVIAEDLGTVPRGFGALLGRWGILSSRVLYFERTEGGGFRPASAYPARALATSTTHDHAPLAAWWAGRDIEIRHALGETDERGVQRAHRYRARERERLLARLRRAGALARDVGSRVTYAELLRAVYRFLSSTPAVLVGLSLDDLAEEMEPVNVPGASFDRFAAWSRRMRLTLDELSRDETAGRALEAVRERRG